MTTCAKHCTYDNNPEKPRPATHGHHCTRCYTNTKQALALAADALEHVVSATGPRSTAQAQDAPVQSSRGVDTPAPIDVDAVAAVDGYFRLIVRHTERLGKVLDRPVPGYARHVWQIGGSFKKVEDLPIPGSVAAVWKSSGGEVLGFRPGLTARQVKLTVKLYTDWLTNNLTDIFATSDIPDVDELITDSCSVYGLTARWPMIMRPRYSDMPHLGECGGKIAIWPPTDVGHATVISCESCGAIFSEDSYDEALSSYRAVLSLQKSKNVADHLARKYSVTCK